MATKTERIEARVAPDERERIERAASATGMSASSFVVSAAVERADEVLAAMDRTVVPDEYFDRLLHALDQPDSAPALAKAARSAKRRQRLTAP